MIVQINRITYSYLHTIVEKSGVSKMFLMFLKEVFYANQCCIYLIKNTVK